MKSPLAGAILLLAAAFASAQTTITIDNAGNVSTTGGVTATTGFTSNGSSGAGNIQLSQGSTPLSVPTSTVELLAPVTVTTAYGIMFPGSASFTGSSALLMLGAPSSAGISTLTFASTVLSSQLPAPTATTLGGIESITSLSHNWVSYIDTLGVPHQGQPAFGDISGTASASQLPPPTATTLGGIESITSLSHNWVSYIDTLGVPHQGQPAFGDISGNATLGQLPSITNNTVLGNKSGSPATPLAITVTSSMTDTSIAPTANPMFTGSVTLPIVGSYNGTTTTGNGMPSDVGTYDLISSHASITGQTIVSSSPASDLYQLNIIMYQSGTTNCTAAGSVSGTYNWTDDAGSGIAQSGTIASLTFSTAGTIPAGQIKLVTAAVVMGSGTTFKVSTTYNSSSGGTCSTQPNYNLRVRVVRQ